MGELSRELREALRARHVLEVACGTGYWTACAAGVALRVTATDASLAMLAEAREKPLPANVELLARDAYDLHDLPSDFDGGLATFWLSHVPRARLRAFLDGFHARLVAGAVVYLADNVYVPGVGGELLPADRAGDTYKVRRLTDGGRHRVLKNYFSQEELRAYHKAMEAVIAEATRLYKAGVPVDDAVKQANWGEYATWTLASSQGDYTRAREALEESLELFRQLGDKENIAATLRNLGNELRYQGDLDRSYALFEEGK